MVAPKAVKSGKTLGIESYHNAAGHLEKIEKVGSKSIKAYMDFRNIADAGFDVLKEMKILDSKNRCELHMKENGTLLGQGTLPWKEITDLIYEMHYYGDDWMQIESAMPAKGNIVDSYKHNLLFLRELFSKPV